MIYKTVSLCTRIGVEHYSSTLDRTEQHEISCCLKGIFYLTVKIKSLSFELAIKSVQLITNFFRLFAK